MLLAAQVAEAGSCQAVRELPESYAWRPSASLAIMLPAASSVLGYGAGHSSVLWKSELGEFVAQFPVLPVSELLSDPQPLCDLTVEGRPAELIEFRRWGGKKFIGLVVRDTPTADTLLFSVEVADRDELLDDKIAVLRSLRFINDPDRITVESIKLENGQFVASVRNELGIVSVVRVGDSITNREGVVERIEADRVVVAEHDGKEWHTFSLLVRSSSF